MRNMKLEILKGIFIFNQHRKHMVRLTPDIFANISQTTVIFIFVSAGHLIPRDILVKTN